jgi:hypothetical protein
MTVYSQIEPIASRPSILSTRIGMKDCEGAGERTPVHAKDTFFSSFMKYLDLLEG